MKKDYTVEIDLLGIKNLAEVELAIQRYVRLMFDVHVEFGEEKEKS